MAEKLGFQQRLQAVTNKVHSTKNIEEILTELSAELCALFLSDRLTIYLTSEDKSSIISKVKTGLTSFRDLKLAINPASIAGYVAQTRKTVNIADVYDQNELGRYSPELRFQQGVDERTGYRTKQMLVAPVLDAQTKDLIGVVQIINSKAGQPFPPMIEEGATHVCETLAIAYKQRQKPTLAIKGKYDNLVTNAVISAEELDLATRSSRRKNLDIETVLIDEFQVKVQAIGEALAALKHEDVEASPAPVYESLGRVCARAGRPRQAAPAHLRAREAGHHPHPRLDQRILPRQPVVSV